MQDLIVSSGAQLLMLLFLLRRDRNDGEKDLFKTQRWNASDAFMLIIMINVTHFIFRYLANIQFVKYLIGRHEYIYPLFLLVEFLVFFRLRIGEGFSILGLNKTNLKKHIAMAMVLAMMNYGVLRILGLFVEAGYQTFEILEIMKNLNDPLAFIKFISTFVVFFPVWEEFVYRVMLYSPYRKKYGPVAGILLISIFSHILHYPQNLIQSFIFSISLGILYEKTESTIAIMTAHAMYNLLTLLTVSHLIQ